MLSEAESSVTIAWARMRCSCACSMLRDSMAVRARPIWSSAPLNRSETSRAGLVVSTVWLPHRDLLAPFPNPRRQGVPPPPSPMPGRYRRSPSPLPRRRPPTSRVTTSIDPPARILMASSVDACAVRSMTRTSSATISAVAAEVAAPMASPSLRMSAVVVAVLESGRSRRWRAARWSAA